MHLFFYRHSDGYPECAGESLKKFCEGYKKYLRNNVGQSAGWLIIQGRDEYADSSHNTWKVGAYEPTDSIHGDIEFLYVIDLTDMTLRCFKHNGRSKGALVFEHSFGGSNE